MQPAHDPEELRLAIMSQLPSRSRWLVRETPVVWDFSRAARPLQALPADDAANWIDVMPADWRQILVFGEEDVADGGGASPFLGIHAETGEVVGLDIERESSAVFLLNSSVPAFIGTFLIFQEWLGTGGPMPRGLRDRLRDLDPGTFERSEWRELVDYLDEPSDVRAHNMPLQHGGAAGALVYHRGARSAAPPLLNGKAFGGRGSAMNRTTYSVIVRWREGEASICSLSEARFSAVRQSWIDEGYYNLQTEWYEARPDKKDSPDRVRVFAYWEGPDEPPSLDQLTRWGREAIHLAVEEW